MNAPTTRAALRRSEAGFTLLALYEEVSLPG